MNREPVVGLARVMGLLLLFGCAGPSPAPPPPAKAAPPNLPCRFTHVRLEATHLSVKPDLSGPHPVQAGWIDSYAIDWTEEDYVVRKGGKPTHGAPPWEPRYKRMLIKDGRDLRDLFDRLNKEFAVFDLTPGPSSEPAKDMYESYAFWFKDSCGKENRITYGIGDGRHTDERYRRLIETLEVFFEVPRAGGSKSPAS